MNKSLSAAITTMLLVTSSAWANTPEGQEIRPTGDNQPGESPAERADESRDRSGEHPEQDNDRAWNETEKGEDQPLESEDDSEMREQGEKSSD